MNDGAKAVIQRDGWRLEAYRYSNQLYQDRIAVCLTPSKFTSQEPDETKAMQFSISADDWKAFARLVEAL